MRTLFSLEGRLDGLHARVQEWWREMCGPGEICTTQLFFTRVQRGGWCGLYWEQEGGRHRSEAEPVSARDCRRMSRLTNGSYSGVQAEDWAYD